ncbi:MAG: hypothetical protein ACE5G1_15105, partial [bacterium]
MRSFVRAFSLLFMTIIFSDSSAAVRVTHRFVNNSAFEVFFLKDFDVNSAAVGPPIFFLEVVNDDPTTEVVVTLCLELHSRQHGNLSRGETRPFTLKRSEVLNLSNKDLFSNSGPYRLDRYEVAEDVVSELLQDILSTGKLPTDVYTFVVQIKDQSRTLLDDESFDIRVSNPKKLDIIGPGSPASRRPRDCDRIFTNLPNIRWDTRMKIVRFTLAEWRPGEDPENALNNEPRFTRIFTIGNNTQLNLRARDLGFNDPIEALHSNAFQYPATDTRLPLRQGKAYVYRLTGLVNSSSGFFAIPSEVYCFRLAKLDQINAGAQQ